MMQILTFQPDPTSWLPVEQVGSMLTHELGYEDKDEFEDALKGSFEDFCKTLPHIELRLKSQRSENENESQCELRMKVDDREERPMKMILKIKR